MDLRRGQAFACVAAFAAMLVPASAHASNLTCANDEVQRTVKNLFMRQFKTTLGNDQHVDVANFTIDINGPSITTKLTEERGVKCTGRVDIWFAYKTSMTANDPAGVQLYVDYDAQETDAPGSFTVTAKPNGGPLICTLGPNSPCEK